MATPLNPSVGARRNHLPKLPLSAFTASSAGSIPGAPPPVDPATIEPVSIIDVHFSLRSTADLSSLSGESTYASKLKGVVVVLSSSDGADKILAELKDANSPVPIKAVTVPVALSNGIPSTPAFLADPVFPISVFSPVSRSSVTPSFTEGLKWALDAGLPVELDVEGSAGDEEQGYEYLAELISSAQEASQKMPTPVIITNVLPPQSSVDLPIVKLISHPGYIAYQSHVGSLSLVPNTFLKFTPPTWTITGEGENGALSDAQVREWKRRVKMYLGPAVEAFGQDRILFGASAVSKNEVRRISPLDWYALARESIVEIGVEQDGVDSIFGGNALAVYSPGHL